MMKKAILFLAIFVASGYSSLTASSQNLFWGLNYQATSPVCPTVPTSPSPILFIALAGNTNSSSGCVPTSSTTVYDSTGINTAFWNGTMSGGVAGTWYDVTSGALPYGGHFNGTNDYLQVSNTGFATGSAAESFGMSVSIAGIPAISQVVLAQGASAVHQARILFLKVGSGAVGFSDYNVDYTSTLIVPTTGIHRIGFIYASGASSITLCLDGTGQTLTLTDGTLGTVNGGASYIGMNFGLANYFAGTINNAVMYSTALASCSALGPA